MIDIILMSDVLIYIRFIDYYLEELLLCLFFHSEMETKCFYGFALGHNNIFCRSFLTYKKWGIFLSII